MTNILTNQYWDYGKSPDIRFTIAYDMQRMGSYMQYKFKWTIHSLNTPTSGFGWPIYATVALDGVNKLNGITIKGSSPMKWYGTELTYESAWVTVPNKENGTTAFRLTMFSGSGMERSQTWTSTLAVADLSSSFSVSDFEFGSAVTVTINKAKENYTHTVRVDIGSHSHSTTHVDTDTSSYTVPLSWADVIPETTETTATISVITYDGTTKVGSTQHKTVKVSVPSSVVPTLSVARTAIHAIGSNYLAGYSQLQLDATADGIYGSTITDIEFTVGTETMNGTATTFTSSVLNTAERVAYSVIATDSRGRKKKVSSAINVVPYTEPRITSAIVRRCNSAGAFKENGTACYVKATAEYDTSISGNTLTLEVSYKEFGQAFYSGEETLISGTGSVHYDGLILLQKSYNILITATDRAGNSAEYVATITSSSNYMLTAKGKKACIGGYVDTTKGDGLQIVGNLYVSGRTYAPTTFYRLVNENVESGGTRILTPEDTYSLFIAIVMKTNGVGGRHTEYIPAAYIDVERIFAPYITDGHKEYSLQYSNGELTLKNQSNEALRIVVYGVV